LVPPLTWWLMWSPYFLGAKRAAAHLRVSTRKRATLQFSCVAVSAISIHSLKNLSACASRARAYLSRKFSSCLSHVYTDCCEGMSGLAQISATERPSAMRPQNLSAHSMLYLVGRPILAGTCVDGVLVLAGIFAQSLLGGATRRCCLPCVVVDLCSIRAQVQY